MSDITLYEIGAPPAPNLPPPSELIRARYGIAPLPPDAVPMPTPQQRTRTVTKKPVGAVGSLEDRPEVLRTKVLYEEPGFALIIETVRVERTP